MNPDSPLAAALIEGDQQHTSGTQAAVTRIVIHATVSGCQRGGARATASYFQSPNSGGLAHYIVDPGEVIQACSEHVVAWHAPPNSGSIGIELCDPQAGDPNRWGDADHQAMLALAARLVADIAKRWGVPIVRLSVADLLNGHHGICGHVDVSQAWHQSDHSDPSHDVAFPWDQFMNLVQGETTMAKLDDDDHKWLTAAIAAGAKSAADAVIARLGQDPTHEYTGEALERHLKEIDQHIDAAMHPSASAS